MNKRNTLVGPQLQRGRAGFAPDWKRLIAFLVVIVFGVDRRNSGTREQLWLPPSAWIQPVPCVPTLVLFCVGAPMGSGEQSCALCPGFRIGSMVTLGGFFVLLLNVARLNFRVNPYLHGSARWADFSDIKAAGLLNNDGVYVGAWRDKRGKIHYLRHAGPEHVLCYAPTRSGKGVGLIVPTLLSWKQSVFVTDLKGELYELIAGWRHEHAHNRILRFEPAAAAGSCCFNPMEKLRIGTEHEVGDA